MQTLNETFLRSTFPTKSVEDYGILAKMDEIENQRLSKLIGEFVITILILSFDWADLQKSWRTAHFRLARGLNSASSTSAALLMEIWKNRGGENMSILLRIGRAESSLVVGLSSPGFITYGYVFHCLSRRWEKIERWNGITLFDQG